MWWLERQRDSVTAELPFPWSEGSQPLTEIPFPQEQTRRGAHLALSGGNQWGFDPAGRLRPHHPGEGEIQLLQHQLRSSVWSVTAGGAMWQGLGRQRGLLGTPNSGF